jgi:hypothetical protein
MVTAANFAFGGKAKVTNDQLVNDALDAFTKAEEKMNNAITLIEENVKAEQEEIKAAEKRIADADASKARLTRVIDRLKALTE